MTQPLRLGLAGIGTVGTGVLRILETQGDMVATRAGREIVVTAVCARSRNKDRGVSLEGIAWEDDPVALAKRDDVDVFIEMIGGEDGAAKASVEAALAAGKHVITANKAMLAHHGQEMAEAAEAANLALRFEAAVAGGIPVVKALTEGLAANKITRVMGVMNGTCNYILTEMAQTGADYTDVLTDAQKLGYAEADPLADVGGFDAAHKLSLLAATAFGTKVDFGAVNIEGIERISLTDIEHAAELGYAIKLLGVARMNDDGLEQRMQPCLVPANSALGRLDGVTNMAVIEGDPIGQTVYEGPGAGSGATASAILADAVDIARGLIIPAFGAPAASLKAAAVSNSGADASYYMRVMLTDQPGTLAAVAKALGNNDVSINRMRQTEHDDDAAPVLIVTHDCTRANLDTALAEISNLDVCKAPPVALRIETV